MQLSVCRQDFSLFSYFLPTKLSDFRESLKNRTLATPKEVGEGNKEVLDEDDYNKKRYVPKKKATGWPLNGRLI